MIAIMPTVISDRQGAVLVPSLRLSLKKNSNTGVMDMTPM